MHKQPGDRVHRCSTRLATWVFFLTLMHDGTPAPIAFFCPLSTDFAFVLRNPPPPRQVRRTRPKEFLCLPGCPYLPAIMGTMQSRQPQSDKERGRIDACHDKHSTVMTELENFSFYITLNLLVFLSHLYVIITLKCDVKFTKEKGQNGKSQKLLNHFSTRKCV